MRYSIVYILLLLLSACNGKRYSVTEEYVFNSRGFSVGLTLILLSVNEYDSIGLPKEYKDSIRIDLHHEKGKIKEKIFFFRENEGYYWQTFAPDKKSTILPFRFTKGMWYGIWAGNFESGLFKTDVHMFFIHCDSVNNIKVYEKIQGTNF